MKQKHKAPEEHYDVIVIGAGPAGMAAAGRAAQRGLRVMLVEKNVAPGRKLLITGKGRCNITNSGDRKAFIESYGKNGKFLYRALSEFSNDDLISFFNELGVATKTERGGRIFPADDRAEIVVDALKTFLARNKVRMLYTTAVNDVVAGREKGSAIRVRGVRVKDDLYRAGAVIIATGGRSYPATGSTGDGYGMAQRLGHRVIPPLPALVPLVTEETWVRELQGLSLKNVLVTAFAGKKKIGPEFGEMLFTHFGISGPIILQMSGNIVEHLQNGERVTVSINLKPALTKEQLDARVLREFERSGLKAVSNVLGTLLPHSLIPVIVSLSGISGEKKCHQVTRPERERILSLLTSLTFVIRSPRPIDEAIVTRGGVHLAEIDPHTMQSRLVRGLYFCGEVIDIDGKTGGYNLQAAFSTGFLAGSSVEVVDDTING